MVSAAKAASESRTRRNGALLSRPLAAGSVNHRDHAAAVKRMVIEERVAAALVLAASAPTELRRRNTRIATKLGSDARAGTPPAGGCGVQGKHGYPSTNGSFASRKRGSSSEGGPAGMKTAVTAAIQTTTMAQKHTPNSNKHTEHVTPFHGAAQRAYRLAPSRCDCECVGYLPSRRAHATSVAARSTRLREQVYMRHRSRKAPTLPALRW